MILCFLGRLATIPTLQNRLAVVVVDCFGFRLLVIGSLFTRKQT
jgi:hypothetical protein